MHQATPLRLLPLLFGLTLAATQTTQTTHAATLDGKRIFQNNCAMCHSASPDMATLAGPPLFNVVGRKVAGVAG